jgi:hypothetical protein
MSLRSFLAIFAELFERRMISFGLMSLAYM